MQKTISPIDLKKKRVFSLPINPKLTPEYIEESFIPFLKKHDHLIYDLYFTSRMPPFMQDAMGEIFSTTNDAQQVVKNSLFMNLSFFFTKLSTCFSASFNVSP